jgi:23S rRNA (cytosine1962-C5)-methyltransferase
MSFISTEFPEQRGGNYGQSAQLFNRSFARRAPLRTGGTDALRLVDAEGDGFGDLVIDDFAGRWLVQTRGENEPPELAAIRALQPAPRAVYWKKLAHDKEPPVWIAGDELSAPFEIIENGLKYWIDFQAGYSQGIFLDQRDNRARLREIVARRMTTHGASSLLNTFAYTCAFGVAGAAAGATTVNLDLSKRYLDWGRRNYERNGTDPAAHDFIFGDVFDWLRRLAKRQRRFDIIVLDPPTFSRDDKGRVFTVEKNFGDLVRLALALLAPDGALLCSTNQRSLFPDQFRRLIESGLPQPRAWRFDFQPMPADFPGGQYLKSCWVARME